MSTLSRVEREELNALSKEVFGASSRWQKLITKGVAEVVTETTTEYVPAEDGVGEGTTREVEVPVKRKDGALISRTKHFDKDTVKTYMLERKVKLEEFKAMIDKMKADEAAKKAQDELEANVQEEIGGSSL